MEKYRFGVISTKDENKNLQFDVRCLHCLYLFKKIGEKYINKVVSRIVLKPSEKVSAMLKVELTPAAILPGMKGGAYTPTFETLPCSTKERIVSQLLSDSKEKLGNFAECAEKKCSKFTETWKMYNVFYKGKPLTRIYRKEIYDAQLISDELQKILHSYSKYYSQTYDLQHITVKTETGEDITALLFPCTNLFLNSDLDFLDEWKI